MSQELPPPASSLYARIGIETSAIFRMVLVFRQAIQHSSQPYLIKFASGMTIDDFTQAMKMHHLHFFKPSDI